MGGSQAPDPFRGQGEVLFWDLRREAKSEHQKRLLSMRAAHIPELRMGEVRVQALGFRCGV